MSNAKKVTAAKKISGILKKISIIFILIAIYIGYIEIHYLTSNSKKTSLSTSGWHNGELVIHGGNSLTFNAPTSAVILRLKDVAKWNMDFLPPYNSTGYCIIWSLGRAQPDTIWAKRGKGPPFVRFNWDERTFWIWSGPSPQKMLISTE